MILINQFRVVPTIFPDKTTQVWKLPPDVIKKHNFIEWRFEHEGGFLHLAQLKTLISAGGYKASLYMPYLPYARQDKPITNDTTFALHAFIHLLHVLDFQEITAFDPHNAQLLLALLPGFRAITPEHEINHAFTTVNADLIVYPDAGAQQRYSQLISTLSIHADKKRDQSTGKIITLNIKGDYQGRRLLIVDDLCDGGMTFVRLAEILQGATEISLYVSHGIFSKGTAILKQAGISRIFTREGEIK